MGRWNFDPALLSIIAILATACWLAADRARPMRKRALVAAFALAILLFVSPFCALTSALFSARVVHHVILTAVLAPLIVFSLKRERLPVPGPLAAWTGLQAVVFWVWHAPGAYSAALSSDPIYWLMQMSLLVSSLAFWSALRSASPQAAVGALLASMVQMGLLGALITFAGSPLYAPHLLSTETWGFSALQDQQLAGLIMWAPAAGLYLAAALHIVNRWLRTDQRLPA